MDRSLEPDHILGVLRSQEVVHRSREAVRRSRAVALRSQVEAHRSVPAPHKDLLAGSQRAVGSLQAGNRVAAPHTRLAADSWLPGVVRSHGLHNVPRADLQAADDQLVGRHPAADSLLEEGDQMDLLVLATPDRVKPAARGVRSEAGSGQHNTADSRRRSRHMPHKGHERLPVLAEGPHAALVLGEQEDVRRPDNGRGPAPAREAGRRENYAGRTGVAARSHTLERAHIRLADSPLLVADT